MGVGQPGINKTFHSGLLEVFQGGFITPFVDLNSLGGIRLLGRRTKFRGL